VAAVTVDLELLPPLARSVRAARRRRGANVSKPFVSKPFVSKPFVSKPFVSKPFVSKPFVSKPFVSKRLDSVSGRSRSSRRASWNAAIAEAIAGAEVLLTRNHDDFPPELLGTVRVQTADTFLNRLLRHRRPAFLDVLVGLAGEKRHPPVTPCGMSLVSIGPVARPFESLRTRQITAEVHP
jgi:hypothetical protein